MIDPLDLGEHLGGVVLLVGGRHLDPDLVVRRGRRCPRSRSVSSSRSRSGIRAASTWMFAISTPPRSPRFGSNSCRCDRRGQTRPLISDPRYTRRRRGVDAISSALVAVTAQRRVRPLHRRGELAEPASGEVRDLAEPATGEPLARAAMAAEADVDRAVEAARAALDGPWGKTPPNERSRLLHALADAIVANRKELAELESRNVGKAISSVKAELAQARRELPLLRAPRSRRSPAARTRSAARCSTTR